MGADNGRHEVDDIVTPQWFSMFGKKTRAPKGLEHGYQYTITHISRCLDGAYSWDDITLEGFDGVFCEFDLDTVKRGR